MTNPSSDVLERLAEHLCARKQPETPIGWPGWLEYSLNRCGLVVIDEHRLATIERLSAELERVKGEIAQPIARVRNRLSRHRESGTLRTEILIYDKDVEALLKAADALSDLTLGGSSAQPSAIGNNA